MEGGAPDLGEEAMRAKLEAANAPPLLPTGFRLMWLSWNDARNPVFELKAGKWYLAAGQSDIITYGKLLTLRLSEEEGELYGDCRAPGCKQTTRLTQKPSTARAELLLAT